ncbi:MAG: cell division protein FtsQ/DivIB [Akkermansiaceae bacterium]
MFKKKTSKLKRNKRTRHDRELDLNVSSPRIVFFQSLKAIRGMMKTIIILLIVGSGCWFGYKQISDHFNNNEEFAIKSSPVTNFEGKPTVVLPRLRVLEIANVDLGGTIFSVDLDEVKRLLLDRPEIRDVKVKRTLPNTIDIQIDERVPVAWLSCRELGLAGRSPHKGVLLDATGVSFMCEKDFWRVAKNLPVIEVSSNSKTEFPIGKKMRNADAERALSLVLKLREMDKQPWAIDRVKVENFYTLHVISKDGVVAVCGMHDHDRQLHQLILAREHAVQNQKELAWIDLRPKTNIPAHYKGGGAVLPHDYTPKSVEDDGLDPSTRSILNQN